MICTILNYERLHNSIVLKQYGYRLLKFQADTSNIFSYAPDEYEEL